MHVKSVDVGNGRCAFVVRVPRSWNPPHRVNFKNWNRFFARNSNGAHEVNVEELRALFTASASVAERVREFRTNRVNIKSVAGLLRAMRRKVAWPRRKPASTSFSAWPNMTWRSIRATGSRIGKCTGTPPWSMVINATLTTYSTASERQVYQSDGRSLWHFDDGPLMALRRLATTPNDVCSPRCSDR